METESKKTAQWRVMLMHTDLYFYFQLQLYKVYLSLDVRLQLQLIFGLLLPVQTNKNMLIQKKIFYSTCGLFFVNKREKPAATTALYIEDQFPVNATEVIIMQQVLFFELK